VTAVTATAASAAPAAASSLTQDFPIVEESPNRRFQRFDEVIGQGGFKTVYRGYDSLEGCEVAWNTVRLTGIPEDEKRRIVKEVKLLYTLKHNNILEFRGTWVKSMAEIVFITEVLSAGSLKNFIRKVRVIRWKVVKRWCIEILKGLEYLHDQDPPVIHRDLKCDNIFVNGQKGDLRIGDLGLSRRKVVADRQQTMMTMAGTPAFMAPEFYTEKYDEKVDIYAFGMCVLEMVTKEYPYTECANTAQIMKLVMEGKLPQSLSRVSNQSARDFITQCLRMEPFARPSAKDLMNHNFLSPEKYDEEEVTIDPPVGIAAGLGSTMSAGDPQSRDAAASDRQGMYLAAPKIAQQLDTIPEPRTATPSASTSGSSTAAGAPVDPLPEPEREARHLHAGPELEPFQPAGPSPGAQGGIPVTTTTSAPPSPAPAAPKHDHARNADTEYRPGRLSEDQSQAPSSRASTPPQIDPAAPLLQPASSSGPRDRVPTEEAPLTRNMSASSDGSDASSLVAPDGDSIARLVAPHSAPGHKENGHPTGVMPASLQMQPPSVLDKPGHAVLGSTPSLSMPVPGAVATSLPEDLTGTMGCEPSRSQTVINIDLDIPIHGESHIVSFDFDYEQESPKQIAQDLCEAYGILDQHSTIHKILAGIQRRCCEGRRLEDRESAHSTASSPGSGNSAPTMEDSVDPDLEAKKLKETKYEQNRLHRMEENKLAKVKMEEQRRKNHEKEVSELEKRINKEKMIIEEKKRQIESEWRAKKSTSDLGTVVPWQADAQSPPLPPPGGSHLVAMQLPQPPAQPPVTAPPQPSSGVVPVAAPLVAHAAPAIPHMAGQSPTGAVPTTTPTAATASCNPTPTATVVSASQTLPHAMVPRTVAPTAPAVIHAASTTSSPPSTTIAAAAAAAPPPLSSGSGPNCSAHANRTGPTLGPTSHLPSASGPATSAGAVPVPTPASVPGVTAAAPAAVPAPPTALPGPSPLTSPPAQPHLPIPTPAHAHEPAPPSSKVQEAQALWTSLADSKHSGGSGGGPGGPPHHHPNPSSQAPPPPTPKQHPTMQEPHVPSALGLSEPESQQPPSQAHAGGPSPSARAPASAQT